MRGTTLILGSFLGLMAAGCSGVLTANNRELVRAQGFMAAGQPRDALDALAKRPDDLCRKLDRAVYMSALGDVAGSNSEFDRAIQQIRGYEKSAVVSASGTSKSAGSLLVNDKVRDYQGEGFEKVLVHALKARNYLLLGDVEAARVEIRNANMRQDEERKRHQDEIDAAAKEGSQAKVDMGRLSGDIDAKFADCAGILARLDNVYQNPFATYLSGVVYELNDEPGDAFIDYKKAYQMVPNPVIGADLARLAAKLHRKDEVAGLHLPSVDAKAAAGNALVIVDNGFAPQKVEIKFPIPVPNNVLFAAVPITRPVPTNVGEVEIVDGNGRTHQHDGGHRSDGGSQPSRSVSGHRRAADDPAGGEGGRGGGGTAGGGAARPDARCVRAIGKHRGQRGDRAGRSARVVRVAALDSRRPRVDPRRRQGGDLAHAQPWRRRAVRGKGTRRVERITHEDRRCALHQRSDSLRRSRDGTGQDRRERRPVSIRPIILVSALVVLSVTSCAGRGGNRLEVATASQRLDQRIVIGSKNLERKLSFGDVVSRQEGLLLHVQVSLENVTGKPVSFEYKWEWSDASGFQLGDTLSSWQPAVVDANAHKLMSGVGPGPSAVNFRLYVRDATS
jgi:uncharacterized protein YcfL